MRTCGNIGKIAVIAALLAFVVSCTPKQSQTRSNEVQGALARHAAQNLGVSEALESSPQEWEERRANEIAPGFTLLISNSADRSINGEYEVPFNGILELPYDVQVKADNRTPTELAGDLNQAYGKYIKNPRFRVLIQKRQYAVDVRGLVEQPGSYVLDVHEGLDAALGQAEGLKKDPNGKPIARFVRFTQLGKSRVVTLQDYFSGTEGVLPPLQGGERMFFQSEGPSKYSELRKYVQILGQVSSPGAYPFQDQSDFMQYLTSAGGPTAQADLTRMTLLRRENNKVSQLEVDINDINGSPQPQGGDVLIIHANNRTPLERDTSVASAIANIFTPFLLVFGL